MTGNEDEPIRITHTYAEGTLLDGTSKADMPRIRDVLRRYSWKWGRSIGMWFQQSSRDQLPRAYRIEQTAKELRELGYTVEVEIDTTPRDMAEQEADREQRMDDRAAALDAKAERRQGESDGRRAAADQVFNSIPFGQPILIGHHSEKADRNRRERAWNNLGKALELQGEADRAAGRADTAHKHMRRRYSPRQVLSRIKALETELGKVELYLNEGTLDYGWNPKTGRYDKQVRVPITDERYRAQLEEQKADLENKLAYWRPIHEQNIADGKITDYGPDTVHVGDEVRGYGLGWHRVVRVNKKSVTINTFRSAIDDKWLTGTLPYHEITGLRPGHRDRPEPTDLDQL